MTDRRKHGRIRDELDPDIRGQVDRLLIEGATYDDVKAFLARRGVEIGRSSIGRYGKEFLSAYGRLRVVEDKSRALVSEAGDGLILEEAAAKIFAQMIIEAQLNGEIHVTELPRIIGDFAKLQSSSAQRERVKAELKNKAKKIIDEVEKGKASMTKEELLTFVKERIYGL